MAFYLWGKEILESLEEKVKPSHTALVVVDLQNDFVHPGGDAAHRGDVQRCFSVLGPNQKLLEWARQASILVVYTQFVQRADGALASAAWLARNLEQFGGKEPRFCMEGTWGWQIADAVAPAPTDVVIQKNRGSSFQGTNLDLILRNQNIKTLVVTGVATASCVESTVRDALQKDYFVVVPRDCVADLNPTWHEEALKALERILLKGDFTTTDRLLQIWSQTGEVVPSPMPRSA